jgi:polar amino acid transport system substrate-binding protein
MKNFKIFILFVICFFPAPNTAISESIRIVTPEMPPFGFYTEDKKSSGILYEISNQIAEEAGFSYSNRIVPFARLIWELESGMADFGIFLVSKENEKIAIKVAPIIPLENIVVGMKGMTIPSLESLHGKKVATVRGAKYDEAFTQDDAIKKYETSNYEQSIKMLVNHRFDAMIGPAMGLYFTAKRLGYSRNNFGVPLVLNTKDTWLQYSITTADQKKIQVLKKAVERLAKKNLFQDIISKYLDDK